ESALEELDPPAAVRLPEIDIPTLVLEAEHDPPFSRRESRLIAEGIIDARLVVIEGADHVINLRQPERFDEVVLAFLDEARPTGGDGPTSSALLRATAGTPRSPSTRGARASPRSGRRSSRTRRARPSSTGDRSRSARPRTVGRAR